MRIAVGAPTVPVGSYTREIIARLGAGVARRIERNIRSNEPDVAGVTGKVAQGAVDAGFVYVTDVRAAGDRLRAIEIPARLRPQVVYGAAVVEGDRPHRGCACIRGRAARGRRSTRPRTGRVRTSTGTVSAAARPAWTMLLVGATAITLCFLTLPVAAIFVDAGPAELLRSLDDPVAVDALVLSLEATAVALVVIVLVGTPTAYLLATRRFRGRALAITLIELPLILPPAAAGIGLLAALGPQGLIGPALTDLGIELPLTTAGVVVALVFVSSPFYVRQAQAAFSDLDPNLIDASRTLGASEARTVLRVAIPLALPSLATGAALAWGRALGEFGATLMFAGSFRGVTQTAPLAIFERFASDFDAALALSAVLVGVSAALLLAIKLLVGRDQRPHALA